MWDNAISIQDFFGFRSIQTFVWAGVFTALTISYPGHQEFPGPLIIDGENNRKEAAKNGNVYP